MAQGSALLYSVACARRSGGKRREASRTASSSAWPVASPSGQPKALPASAKTSSPASTINAAKGCLPRAFAAAESAMAWRRYRRSRSVAVVSIRLLHTSTQSGVQHISQHIAKQVAGQYGSTDRQPREESQRRYLLHELSPSATEHPSPGGAGGGVPKPRKLSEASMMMALPKRTDAR